MRLPDKPAPYTFVPIVTNKETEVPLFEPVFHSGTLDSELLSGELHCEITCLTPLLVGHFQYKIKDRNDVTTNGNTTNLNTQVWGQGVGQNVDSKKSFLEPLFLNNETSPVLIPGTSIKGMIRHNIGAMLSAPMERVQEQYFSYRPNQGWNNDPTEYECKEAIITEINEEDKSINVEIIKNGARNAIFKFSDKDSHTTYTEHYYVGGLDGGEILSKTVYKQAWTPEGIKTEEGVISAVVVKQYKKTQKEMADVKLGHVSRRSDLSKDQKKQANIAVLKTLELKKNQLIYVELDKDTNQIVSFGHHFRYRWRYADSIHKIQSGTSGENTNERMEITSPDNETVDGSDTSRLTGARLLFGYTDGNEDSENDTSEKDHNRNLKIAEKDSDYSRLAGRIAVNTGVEQIQAGSTLDTRFIKRNNSQTETLHRFTIPLKILGQPRSSAVEHYLQQDSNFLNTYGDLPGVETSGNELNGRKFYRHQPVNRNSVFTETNKEKVESQQTTFAQFISNINTKFRFKLRFKDLRKWEFGAILLALNPELKRRGTANKLGHGRPLGLGSIKISIDTVKLLNNNGKLINQKAEELTTDCIDNCLYNQEDIHETQINRWLDVLNYNDAASSEYPQKNGEIYTYHTNIRSGYSIKRRDKAAMPENYGDPVKPK